MKLQHPLLVAVSAVTMVLLLVAITIGTVDALAADDEAPAPEVGALPPGPVAAPQSESATPTTTTTSTTSTTTTTLPSTTTTTAAPAPQESVAKSAVSTPTTTTTVAPATTPAPATTTTTTAPPATTTTTTAPPATTTTTTAPPVGGYDASAEGQLVSLINNLRASAGVPGLAHIGELRSYARGWSKHMGETGTLAHSNLNNIPGPWQSAAENVAVSPTVKSAFDMLVGSSGHYANMVNPTFTEFGVGVWADADGTLWVTNVFRG